MKRQHLFEDGSIGYTEEPEGVRQQILVDGVGPAEVRDLHVDDDTFKQMREESHQKEAVRDNKGKFMIRDKVKKPK